MFKNQRGNKGKGVNMKISKKLIDEVFEIIDNLPKGKYSKCNFCGGYGQVRKYDSNDEYAGCTRDCPLCRGIGKIKKTKKKKTVIMIYEIFQNSINK